MVPTPVLPSPRMVRKSAAESPTWKTSSLVPKSVVVLRLSAAVVVPPEASEEFRLIAPPVPVCAKVSAPVEPTVKEE